MPNPNNPLAPGLNGAAPKGPRTIWDNPVFSAVLAIIMGFAMWIIVTVYIDPQGSTTVTGVPINYTSGASTYTAQGLDIVEKPDIEGVTVKVEGNSTIIGNIRSADIMVHPSYAGVSGAGKVTLRLQARVTNTTDFPGDIECTVESPSTIDVVFDEVSEKTVPVTVDASAVTISSGYMLNKTTAVPAEISCAARRASWIRCPASSPRSSWTASWPTPRRCLLRWSCATRRATPSRRSISRWRATPPTSR